MHNSTNIPHLDPRTVQTAIRELEALHAEFSTIGDYERHLIDLLKGYAVVGLRLEPGFEIYRARSCTKPKRIKELSYPPAVHVNSLGRANDINQSMFYGATSRRVPFFELELKSGDYVALSKWRSKKTMMVNHVGFSAEPKSFEDCERNLDAVYEFVMDTRAQSDLNSLVHDYLAFNFSRKVESNDEYKFPVAISKRMFGNNDLIEALLYPSIQMNGNADNLVLSPEVVDQKLEFVSAEYIHIKSIDDLIFETNVEDSATGVDANGNLLWTGRHLKWVLPQGCEFRMVVEDGQFVAYASNGQKIDPT